MHFPRGYPHSAGCGVFMDILAFCTEQASSAPRRRRQASDQVVLSRKVLRQVARTQDTRQLCLSFRSAVEGFTAHDGEFSVEVGEESPYTFDKVAGDCCAWLEYQPDEERFMGLVQYLAGLDQKSEKVTARCTITLK